MNTVFYLIICTPLFLHQSKSSKMENIENLEKNLLALLKDAKAPSSMLKRTSASLAVIGKTDMEMYRVIINGIPWPEWVVIKGRVRLDNLDTLQHLLSNDLISEIKLRPHGVGTPVPFEIGVSARLNLNGHANYL